MSYRRLPLFNSKKEEREFWHHFPHLGGDSRATLKFTFQQILGGLEEVLVELDNSFYDLAELLNALEEQENLV